MAPGVDRAIESQDEVIQPRAKRGEPSTTLHGAIEFIPVNHQQPAALERLVNVFGLHLEIAEGHSAYVPELLVMIAWYKDHARAVLGLAQNRAQHVAMRLRPVKISAQAPDIDNVANQNQLVGLHPAQKVENQIGA